MSIDPIENRDRILKELNRILSAPLFKGAKRSSSFLKYICEKTVNGESNSIKEYSIAVDAFGLELNFDQQLDPRIRVEAKRLRDRLDLYYKGPGVGDDTIISLEKGSYIPAFTLKDDPEYSTENLRQALLLDRRFLIAIEITAPQPPESEGVMLFANDLVAELHRLSRVSTESMEVIAGDQKRARSLLLEIRGQQLPGTFSLISRISLGEGGALLWNSEIRLESEELKETPAMKNRARKEAEEIVGYCRSVES